MKGNFVRTYEIGAADRSTRTEIVYKKQSIPQVCTWGMGFLETPINKMPVKIYACKPTFVQNWKL